VLWYDTNVSEVHAASYHNTTRHHNPEDVDVNLHRCENLEILTQNKSLSTPLTNLISRDARHFMNEDLGDRVTVI